MRLSIIVAMSPDGVIGREGRMPWHMPSDLKRFRRLTMGKPVIMGRRTFESLGKPLDGRTNIVLTRSQDMSHEGVFIARSPEAALEMARSHLDPNMQREVFVLGGAEVFRHFLSRADRAYVTWIDGRFEGDTIFPLDQFRALHWTVRSEESIPADARNPYPQRFEILERTDDAHDQ